MKEDKPKYISDVISIALDDGYLNILEDIIEETSTKYTKQGIKNPDVYKSYIQEVYSKYQRFVEAPEYRLARGLSKYERS